jgi:sugar lactone lactonase YvrE
LVAREGFWTAHRAVILSTLFVFVLASSTVGFAFTYHVPPSPPAPPKASVVIGQPDFNSSSQGTGKAQLGFPEYVAVDNSGNLWVSDYQNGWVTEYPRPFTDGEAATLEIGAANFSSGGCSTGGALCEPAGIAFDASGNLWAADVQNASVQEFKAPLSLGEASTVLLGGEYLGSPPDRTSFAAAGLAFDQSGNLWVADSGYNRVLEFAPPFTTHEAATLVIGQPNFTTSSNNSNQSKLSGPNSLAFDQSGNLWVADTYDNRVLEFKAPFSSGESASVAVGQPNLLSTIENTTQSTLSQPDGVAFDTHGNLWVADTSNNRVAEFTPPFSTGMSATVIIGQDSYFFSGTGIDQSSLYGPQGIAAGGGGNLWVADTGNDRVLLFEDPSSAAAVSTATTQSSSAPQGQTSATQAASSETGTTTAASSSGGGGIPEFPYQITTVGVFTLALAAAYLFARRRST